MEGWAVLVCFALGVASLLVRRKKNRKKNPFPPNLPAGVAFYHHEHVH